MNDTLPPAASDDEKPESAGDKTTAPKTGTHTAITGTIHTRTTRPGWFAFAGLALLSLAGFGVNAILPGFGPRIDHQAERIDMVGREVTALKSDVTAIGNALNALPDTQDQLKQALNDRARIKVRLDAIDSMLQTSSVSADEPNAMTEEEDNQTRLLTAPETTASLAQSGTRTTNQGGVVPDNPGIDSTRIDPLVTTSNDTILGVYHERVETEPDVQPAASKNDAALAFLEIEAAASRGHSFQQAQRRLASTMTGRAEVERLAALSVIPIPTPDELRIGFQTVMKKALAAKTPKKTSRNGWMHALFGTSIKVRHKNLEELTAILEAAQDTLDRGNLRETLRHLESLDSDSKAIFASWTTKVRQRQTLDEILASLRLTITTRKDQ